MAEHNDFGKEAEELAVKHLVAHGYEIVQRNYFYRKAEIDILAQKEDVLAVIEVKARSTDYFGEPEQFVSRKKIKLLTTAVDHYVIENDLDVEVRFDIISVLRQKNQISVNHIEDAFYHF